MAAKKKNWIKGAIKKPGSLKATAKRAGAMKSDVDNVSLFIFLLLLFKQVRDFL